MEKKSGIYFERHHITPRCMGGSNDPNNLTLLTPEEHFVAHQLLCKITPNHTGLLRASMMMSIHDSDNRNNNKRYGWLRRNLSRNLKGKSFLSPEQRKKLNNSKRGVPLSETTRKRISEANKGRPIQEHIKKYLSDINKGKTHTPEAKEKIRLTSLGRKHTPEAKEKIAASKRGKPRSRETIEKISSKKKGVRQTPEAILARRKSLMGRQLTEDQLQKMRLGKQPVARIEISPGVFKNLNKYQLERFNSTGDYRAPKRTKYEKLEI